MNDPECPVSHVIPWFQVDVSVTVPLGGNSMVFLAQKWIQDTNRKMYISTLKIRPLGQISLLNGLKNCLKIGPNNGPKPKLSSCHPDLGPLYDLTLIVVLDRRGGYHLNQTHGLVGPNSIAKMAAKPNFGKDRCVNFHFSHFGPNSMEDASFKRTFV